MVRRSIIGSAALAIVSVMALPGCAPAPPANAAAGVEHSLTIAAATAAYNAYLDG